MRLTLLFIASLAGLLSCKKEKPDLTACWQCSIVQALDSTAISGKLVGSWTWAKQSCFRPGMVKPADRTIKATFKIDHSFAVVEGANTLTQGTWGLIQVDGNSWRLELSAPSEFLYGRILFCDKQLLFNDSYIDGCDNVFNRSN